MQKVSITVWICVLLAACWVPDSYGHSGGHGEAKLHLWHFTDGSSLRGSFHSVRQQCVVIEDKVGRLHGVPFDRLHPDDRDHAESRLLAISMLHAVPEDQHSPLTPLASPPHQRFEVADATG